MNVRVDNQVCDENLEAGDIFNTEQGKRRRKEKMKKILEMTKRKIKLENLILKIDLVPETSWFNNMRKVTTQSQWDKLRKKTYATYHYTCGICGTVPKMLDCHEIWEYDDKNNIQQLQGLIALCKPCHMIKHIGYAEILASQGKLDMEQLIGHFLRVNDCDEETFLLHRKESFQIWSARSRKQWTVELGEYANWIQKST